MLGAYAVQLPKPPQRPHGRRRPGSGPAGRRPFLNGSTVASRRRSTRTAMPPLSAEARNLNWLVGNFVKNTPGVAPAMVVSADGLPLAVSERLERAKADQLAAIASGLASLSQGTARCFDVGLVKQTVVEMQRGLLFVTSISDGSCLTVLAASSCEDGGILVHELPRLPRTYLSVAYATAGRHSSRRSGQRSVACLPTVTVGRTLGSRACAGGVQPIAEAGHLRWEDALMEERGSRRRRRFSEQSIPGGLYVTIGTLGRLACRRWTVECANWWTRCRRLWPMRWSPAWHRQGRPILLVGRGIGRSTDPVLAMPARGDRSGDSCDHGRVAGAAKGLPLDNVAVSEP